MLNIGETLLLELKHGDKVEKCRCRIVDISEHLLYIDYPINIESQRAVFLIDGTQLKVNLVLENSAYFFESEVLGREMREIPMIKLRYPSEDNIIKIQRRQYVRIHTNIDVAIHPIQKEFTPFTAVTRDISAGGALIILTKDINLEPEMVISSTFVLPMQNGEYHYLTIKSKIVRLIETENSGKKLFSIHFLNVTAQERQILLRFTFDRQVVEKKKGLIS